VSTIPYRNLFTGGAGIFGAVGNGHEPGHSLEVRGNGSTVQVEVVNPGEAELQIERARAGTNMWTPIDEPTTVIMQSFLTVWVPEFIYRVRQLTASPEKVRLFVTNDVPAQINNGSSGGFIASPESIEPKLVDLYDDIPPATEVSSGTLFLVVSDPKEILNGLHVARGTPKGQPALFIDKLKQ